MTEPAVPPQWTDLNVQASTPQQLVSAIARGQLTDLGLPPPRTGRRHHTDAPRSPVADMLAEQTVRAAAAEKALTTPNLLDLGDIAALPANEVARLVGNGSLTHFGMGSRRR